MINRSMESPDYKEKIRVRAYEDNAKTVLWDLLAVARVLKDNHDRIYLR